MAATPGLQEGGHEYYTLTGAERLRDALDEFDGGRVLVAVLGQPFKCPPAPFEGAFMLHEHFKQRGMADAVEISSVFPMERPVPVTGEVAQMFRDGLVSKVEVNFLSGEAPAAQPYGATLAHAAEKDEFGATRRARWFGR